MIKRGKERAKCGEEVSTSYFLLEKCLDGQAKEREGRLKYKREKN